MSATPRCDLARRYEQYNLRDIGKMMETVPVEFARELERENNDLKNKLKKIKEKLDSNYKELHEAKKIATEILDLYS